MILGFVEISEIFVYVYFFFPSLFKQVLGIL